MPDNPTPDELRRQFEAAISGAELDDLRQLTHTLLSLEAAPSDPAPGLFPLELSAAPPRPRLRRPPLPEAMAFRVRVELDNSRPPIWRQLDIRSDATLAVVHQVLQAAFGWADAHLYRFALGGGPFDRTSELFLCPLDVAEGGEAGTPASDVRLDETLQRPDDVLRYVYDYGDGWEVTIRLERAHSLAGAATPMAVCVDGRRAGPPESCGGIVDAASLAEVLDDPARFDADEVNLALHDPYFVLHEAGLHPLLVELAHRLRYREAGHELLPRLLGLPSAPSVPSLEQMVEALRPVTWFLKRGLGDGLALTTAGYLKPADVEEICAILPTMADQIGKNNRENHAFPLQDFRAWLQSNGLLRKNKGRLLTTRAGAALLGQPEALWRHLAARMIPTGKGDFAEQSALLIVAYAASEPDAPVPFDTLARLLRELGWHCGDRRTLQGHDLYFVEGSPLPLLQNLGAATSGRGMHRPLHPVATALAHFALFDAWFA